MNLTRRGKGVLAIVVVGELCAILFGARSLNAVVAPALIALVGAVVQVRRADDPTVTRSAIAPGFPGDTREVTVDVSGEGIAHVSQSLTDSAGFTGEDTETELSLPGSFSFSLSYTERGVYRLGPVSVTVRDLLGLVEEGYRTGGTVQVTVYPPVYQLAGRTQFLENVLDQREVERQEFDALREYVPGDPLRDVHWKSSAKAPDTIYVKEFVDRRIEDDVVVVATADEGYADEMATAAASVAMLALDAGLGVELHAPHVTVPLDRGEDHRTEIFEVLAGVSAGPIIGEEPPGADVRIHADETGVEVTFGSRTRSLEELTVSRDNPLSTQEVSA